jgi:hypothetical protein
VKVYTFVRNKPALIWNSDIITGPTYKKYAKWFNRGSVSCLSYKKKRKGEQRSRKNKMLKMLTIFLGSLKHGKEALCSVKGREFLD